MKTPEEYYKEVATYYDADAPMFEKRYWENKTLQIIRESFREETEKYTFTNALEIGFGPGVDLAYFSHKYPGSNIYGIDISERMCYSANLQVEDKKLNNVYIGKGSVEDIGKLFPGKTFDLIYVYFGTLNTVADLGYAASCLEAVLAPGGKLVITIVNKWYWAGMLLPLIKGRFKIAFRRLQKSWGGYSTSRHLDSRCYTPAEVKKAFSSFKVLRQRGYSILHPAWFQDNLRTKLGGLAKVFWKIDKLLNHTPLWSKGEYTLFVMERKS